MNRLDQIAIKASNINKMVVKWVEGLTTFFGQYCQNAHGP
jgi:hypothetical protein